MTAYGLVIPTEQRCQEFLPSSRARGTAFMSGGGGGHYFQILTLPSSHFRTVRVGGRRGVDTQEKYQLPLAFYAFQPNAPEWSVEYIR